MTRAQQTVSLALLVSSVRPPEYSHAPRIEVKPERSC